MCAYVYIGVLQSHIADLLSVSFGGTYADPLDSPGTMSSMDLQSANSRSQETTDRDFDLGFMVVEHVRTPRHQLSRLSMIRQGLNPAVLFI